MDRGQATTQNSQALTPLGAPAAAVPIPALTVAYHPDIDRVGECAALISLLAGKTVRLSRDEPTFALPGVHQPRPLADRCISRQPILITAPGGGGIRITLGEEGRTNSSTAASPCPRPSSSPPRISRAAR